VLVQAQILGVAADLFGERGYRATTLDDLARRAGMSKATLYGYFRSKEELLAAIFHRTMTLFERGLREVLRPGLPPDERLRRVIRHHVRAVIGERSFLSVFFGEEANLPPRLLRVITRRKAAYDRRLQAIVARGLRAGVFVGVHPRLLVFAILGMSNWVYKWYRPAGAWDADAIADAFIALVETGYLSSGARLRPALARRLRRIEQELLAVRPFLDDTTRRRGRGVAGPEGSGGVPLSRS
jgi:AcrR family transcriptional regulator